MSVFCPSEVAAGARARGDITPFLDTISTIRGLRRLHISLVTDFGTAACKLRGNVVFQKRMDPLKDLELCDTKTMESKIEEVLGVGYPMELDPGPIQTVPIEKIKTWINVARKTIKSEIKSGQSQPNPASAPHSK